MQAFLASSKFIDWSHERVLHKARELALGEADRYSIAKNCFEFVLHDIRHSADWQSTQVTCIASDVLQLQTGFCYAKSHLLAALLRANGIPSGLCYQRLTVTDVPPFCLHGLNAIYFEEFGWVRVDARGNKPGVSADFQIPNAKLAFYPKQDGEVDFPEIWAEPLSVVTSVLERCKTIQEVITHLPDVEILKSIVRR